MSGEVRQGIILAAGRGTRLHPLSAVQPKPMLPVCNKPIMQYQMESMLQTGVAQVTIVTGPNGEAIRQHFGDGGWLGVEIHYVEDPDPTGIASSLALVEGIVTGPFVVFLGDIFLAMENLAPALAPVEEGAAGSIVVCRDTPEAVARNFAVLAEPDGRVTQVIEKPAQPPTDLKGCGVYVFDGTIFEAIRQTPRSALRNEYEITDAVQRLIDMGRPVYAAAIARWDVNVTYAEDLLRCNLRVLEERNLDCVIGPGARISPGARLRKCVVGDGAVVEAPALLEECLVLPHARVAGAWGPVRHRIFTDGWATGATGGRSS